METTAVTSDIETTYEGRKERVLGAIFRSSTLNSIARLFGYFKNVLIAVLLGFTLETDAFFMAISIISIYHIFIGVFDSVGVPNLVRAQKAGRHNFDELSGFLFVFTLLLTFCICIIAALTIPLAARMAVGFSQNSIDYVIIYSYALLPYLFFSFFFHHFGAVLRSTRSFTPYFWCELINSFSCFLLVAIGLLFKPSGIIIPISLSVSQIIATVAIAIIARHHFRWSLKIPKQARLIVRQTVQLSGIYGVFHFMILIDKAFASLLPAKSVTALSFGLMIASMPRSVLRLGNILITPLSEVNADINKLNYYLKKVLPLSLLLMTALSIGAYPLIKLFFDYGAFSLIDLNLTTEAARYYALALPAMMLWPILYRVFQIKNRLAPLFYVAIFGILVNAVSNYIFVIRLNFGLKGVALGTCLANSVLCLISYVLIIKYWGSKRELSDMSIARQ